jgi:hypothetical protein
MEDLILAFVTFVASMFILSHLAGSGMDAFTIVMFVDPSCCHPHFGTAY